MIQSSKNIIWALYARKSQESEDRQVQSIQDQEKYMGDLAKREKIDVKIVIVDAKSAKIKNNREGFTRLMKMVEKGQITGILTWKTDRLSRNPVESGIVMEALQLGKLRCIKTSDRNHYPEDNALIFAVEQGMANQYSRDLANNVRRGMSSKAQKGWWPMQPPIGYLNSKGEGEEAIIKDTECFAIVRKMWDMLLSGTKSIPEIHRIARDELGLRTHKRKRVGGKPLALSYMYILFSNIFYTGNFMYAGQFYKGKHTPMITMDEFDRVQIMLGKKGKPRPQKHDFPYTGIMTCGECHACITATEKKKMVKSQNGLATYTYYHCTRRKKDVDCSQSPVRTLDLENEIKDILSEFAISKPYYETGLQVLQQMHRENNTSNEQVYDLQKQHVKDIESKLNRILEFAINGTLSEEKYNEQKSDWKLS